MARAHRELVDEADLPRILVPAQPFLSPRDQFLFGGTAPSIGSLSATTTAQTSSLRDPTYAPTVVAFLGA